MFFSCSKEEINNKDMQPGETLFQYLKRKKQIALKQSLQTSFQQRKQSKKQNSLKKESKQVCKHGNQNEQKAIQTKRKKKRSSSKKRRKNQSSQSRKQNNSTLSNKKNWVENDQKTTRRLMELNENIKFENELKICNKSRRSFISMISPLKTYQKGSSLSQTKILIKNSIQSRRMSESSENVLKRMIGQKIKELRRTNEEQMGFQKQLREKVKHYFLLVNSVLVQFESQNQQSLSEQLNKKINFMRSSMKLINCFLNSKQEKVCMSQILQDLYTSVNEKIDSLQGQIKEKVRKDQQINVEQLKLHHQREMDEITKQKSRLSRQINGLNKNSEKLLKEIQFLHNQINNLKGIEDESIQKKMKKDKTIVEQLQNQLSQLSNQNVSLKDKIKEIQKKYKDSEYRFDQAKRSFYKQCEQRLSQRESFLLKEINVLKNEFSRDVKNLTQMHVNREDKLQTQIKILESQIKDQSSIIKKLNQTIRSSQQNIKLQQELSKQQKKKNESALIDLCRINQELYKHWLALKDIKILLTRLKMYDKFQRIYKDIPFDQLLFFS